MPLLSQISPATETVAKAERVLTPFELAIQKSDRAVIPEYIWQPQYRIRDPAYSFDELNLIARTNWVLKKTFIAIIRETLSPLWKIEPAFIGKCGKCGKEVQGVQPKGQNACDAPDCGGVLVVPDLGQRKRALDLLVKPAQDRTFYDLIKSALYYDLALDNFFYSISYKYVPDPTNGQELIKVPAELDIEDPRFMRVISDDKGHIGDPQQLFCPECWIPDMYYAPPVVNCPRCGKPLHRTAYVQRIAGAIKARYTKEEIIHGSTDRVIPNLYGESRIISLWKLLMSMMAMDDFNLELYTEGKLGSIVNFPGHDQEEVNDIMDQFEGQSIKKRVYDPILRRWRTTKKIRTMMIASKEPVRVTRIMEDFRRMQSLEFYKFWKAGVASVYSVMPIFTGDIEAGKAGTTPMMQVTVQDRAITEKHRLSEDIINNRVFPIFGITDWKFVFNKLDNRDRMRLAQIGQIKANTAFTWQKAGYRTRLNEQGELEVWGEGQPPDKDKTPPQPESIPIDSEATGELRDRTGRFAPKPAGDQGEAYKSEWVNPTSYDIRKSEDVSRRA